MAANRVKGVKAQRFLKRFSCLTQLSMKFSCSAIFSKKEFAIVSNLRFISRINFMLYKQVRRRGIYLICERGIFVSSRTVSYSSLKRNPMDSRIERTMCAFVVNGVIPINIVQALSSLMGAWKEEKMLL